jgi:hypothetical protein
MRYNEKMKKEKREKTGINEFKFAKGLIPLKGALVQQAKGSNHNY